MKDLYELWLHSICDFEPETVEKMVFVFERDSEKFSSSEKDIAMVGKLGIPEKIGKRLSDADYFSKAYELEEYCGKNEIRLINAEASEYPDFLRHTNTPPRILFAKGEKIDLNKSICVSVVGTRKPTSQGLSVARQLGRKLAEAGIIVVSGMAEGIDAEAHKGAIEAGGKTVAVLAGGVDAIYPKSNEKLYYEILKNGMIVSERPPGTIVKRYFYQQRNRIVVGLSHGTVIVEGKEKSGTSMTARIALDNNRDVFAVPGNPVVWQSELPNRLISEGALIVDKMDGPVEYYRETRPEFFRNAKRTESNNKTKIQGLSEDDEKILGFIRNNGGVADIEELSEGCNLAPNVLGSRLTVLSVRGILRQESGNRYVLAIV